MNFDKVTEVSRKAINILFVSNPKGTSIGVLIGVILDGVFGALSPALKTIPWINASAIKTWHLIGLGVVGMNLPSYLQRKQIDPSIVNAIKYIEEQKTKGHVSEWQARQMYANLHKKVLDSVALESNQQEIANKINSIITQPKRGKGKE